MKKALLLLLPLIFLAGCGKDELQGNVTDKSVHAGYDFVYMMPMYSSTCTGKPAVCTSTVTSHIPIWYHVPTCYKIVVKGDHSGDTCVDEGVWEGTHIGDYYEGKDVNPKDRKVKK